MTQEVFDFFYREHGLVMLESEYNEIQKVVNADLGREIIGWKNELSSANAQLADALRERDEARAMVAELKALLRDREDGDALLEEMGLIDEEEGEILSTTCGTCYHVWPGDVKKCPGCGADLE